MSRPKSLPETHRECRTCKLVLELNRDNFATSKTNRNGYMLDCRKCWARERREYWASYRSGIVRNNIAKRMGDHCGECFGLPWRVQGCSCPACGLAYGEEPPPELVFWRSTENIHVG